MINTKIKRLDYHIIFLNKATIQQDQQVQNDVALIEVKENLFTKFLKKLKYILHIN